MDFMISVYTRLLAALQRQGFLFMPVNEARESNSPKSIILRHDVDKSPENSLVTAQIENDLGMRGTYYFRIVPESYDEEIISEIHSLGHEIGYHYEDVDLAVTRQKAKDKRQKAKDKRQKAQDKRQKSKDKRQKAQDKSSILDEEAIATEAADLFKENLAKFREIYPVETICMHGSPLSKWDNRLLWKYYDYREFGIKAEPYFDFDFSEMFYLTDTGRRWDGAGVSVRDKVLGTIHQGLGIRDQGLGIRGTRYARAELESESEIGRGEGDDVYAQWKVKPVKGSLMNMTPEGLEFQRRHSYHTTNEIIKAVKDGFFPNRAMITVHPQRWTDRPLPWMKELVWQNTKNIVKYYLVKTEIRRR